MTLAASAVALYSHQAAPPTLAAGDAHRERRCALLSPGRPSAAGGRERLGGVRATRDAWAKRPRLDLRTTDFALVATEDRSFYQHHGVSIRGIGRAIYSNFMGGSRQGGSTITQQLVKNFYLNSDLKVLLTPTLQCFLKECNNV